MKLGELVRRGKIYGGSGIAKGKPQGSDATRVFVYRLIRRHRKGGVLGQRKNNVGHSAGR